MSDKKHKSIVEVFIDTVVDQVVKDIQPILDLLPECKDDDVHQVVEKVFKSEGNDDE